MSRAAFALSKDDLARIMLLPNGWKITHVASDSSKPDGVIFIIEGQDESKFPSKFVRARYYFDDDGLVTGVNWKSDER